MKNKKAFSLLELIFVIAVLGIIAAISIPKFLNSKTEATINSIKQDITTISTSIQSYYLINNKIDKISDSVNINESVWSVEDKKVEYKIDESVCIKIEIVNNKLNVIVNENSSDICKKIYDSGIRSNTYELF